MGRSKDEQWHGWDSKKLAELHLKDGKAAEDKGCLTPHQTPRKEHCCSYHWQAFEKAQSENSRYKWPKDVPDPQPPSGRSTDWDPKNWIFSASGNHPCYYPREAHHLVPFGSLMRASCTATSGDRKKKEDTKLVELFGGLLKKGYNLNDQRNMAYLPATHKHARALQLPYHNGRHGTYNRYVEGEIDKIFAGMLETIDRHLEGDGEEPDYGKCVKAIRALSGEIYLEVKTARLPEDRVNGEHDDLKCLALRMMARR